jgi:RimJ/RimL family protein N-acetyltransferase
MRIETARLTLDLPMLADFEAFAEMWADPQTTRFVGGPSARNDAWTRLLRLCGLWPLLGYGYWMVREKASGRLLGTLGFADFHRDLQPPHPCAPEAGWVFARWAHGRGFAREALTAAFGWFDASPAAGACHCLIDPENAASLRLAAAFAFANAREITFEERITLLLTRQAASGG